MSDAKQKIDLDAALGAWPQKPSDARVDVIVARLGTAGDTADSVTDDELFGAPFEGDDDFVSPASAEREKDRQSLRDLAKLATDLTPTSPVIVLRGRESRADDSGIVDLAAAAKADPESVFRAQSTPLASEGLFDEAHEAHEAHDPHDPPLSRHPASMPSMPSSMPSIPIVALSSRRLMDDVAPTSTSTSSSTSSSAPRHAKRGVPLYLAGMVAITAAAAAFFFLMKGLESATPVSTVTTSVVPAPPSASVTPEPAVEPATSVAALDPAPTPTVAPTTKTVVATRPEPAPAETVKPAAQAPDLSAQIRKEMNDEGADQQPAAGNNGSGAMGNVPQKPSQGVITGALGVALPDARACLGPDDPVARASIVFGSNGAAQSVTVTPAGGESETCIKTALLKAKVSPFAEPTFTAITNVRHN